ncbi:N-acetyltransferase family protein [Pseudoroseicyclus sp. CXY001]|uniref:GNAT family N-acetyltransferase n=1 Tax=Pseudoroseicyclus sp. CXY001 TaxID=3242492 RepID=UPI0035715A71
MTMAEERTPRMPPAARAPERAPTKVPEQAAERPAESRRPVPAVAPPAAPAAPAEPLEATVRKLGPADVIAYRHVRLEALREHPAAFGTTFADMANAPHAAFAERLEQAAIFGLYTAHGLEGLMCLARERGSNTRHRATITQVYLREKLRGQGGAAMLLEALVTEAEATGIRQLELTVAEDNRTAHDFYARHGFTRIGVIPRALRIDGAYVDEILMMRRVGEDA